MAKTLGTNKKLIDVGFVKIRYNASYQRASKKTIDSWAEGTGRDFVGVTAIKSWNGEWTPSPYPIFRNLDKSLCAIYRNNAKALVVKPLTNEDGLIEGIYYPANNVFVYSTCRHDFWQADNCPVFVDGGRDYVKIGGNDLDLVHGAMYQMRTGKILVEPKSDTQKGTENERICVGQVEPNHHRNLWRKASREGYGSAGG